MNNLVSLTSEELMEVNGGGIPVGPIVRFVRDVFVSVVASAAYDKIKNTKGNWNYHANPHQK